MKYRRERMCVEIKDSALHVFLILFVFILGLCTTSCKDEEQPSAYEEKLERDRFAIQNQCKMDTDCHVSGCHQTLCRATLENDFCEHRFVLKLDHESDLAAVKQFVRNLLTEREAETLQSGGYAAGLWTISFHASLGQRQRVIEALRAVSSSGLARVDKKGESLSRSLFESLFAEDRDLSLVSMEGVGDLVEKTIRSGDVLSRKDISKTWEHLSAKLPNAAELGYTWDYDVVIDKLSSIRLWPVYRSETLAVFEWENFEYVNEWKDLRIKARVSDAQAKTLQRWSKEESLILLILGREVLVPAAVRTPIVGTDFEILIRNAVSDEALHEGLNTLKLLYEMNGFVQFDEKATAKVERDTVCAKQVTRDCACVLGNCQWRFSKEFNACMAIDHE